MTTTYSSEPFTIPTFPLNKKKQEEATAPAKTTPKVTTTTTLKARQPAGISLPDSQEGIPIPYFCGTIRVDGNILWYGNADTEILNVAYTQLDGTVSYIQTVRDTVDVMFGIATGPGVRLRGIYGENNAVIWTGNKAPNDYTPFLTGKTSGIFAGNLTWYGGEFNQPRNAEFAASIIGEDVPAFVGISYLWVTNGDRSTNTAMSFEVQRLPNPLSLSTGVNVSADGNDINPASLVIDFMTSKWNGAGNDIGSFDVASFVASANTLAAEGNFCSAAVSDDATTADDLISTVETQVDGTIFTHPGTGLITFRLFREDSVDLEDPDLLVFDNTEIQGHPGFNKVTWDNTINQMRVLYSDRTEGYSTLPAIAQTIDVAASGGRTRLSKSMNFPLVTTKDLASKIASRELKTSAIPRHTIEVTTSRKGAYLLPGDVILIDWSNYKLARTPYYVVKRQDLSKKDNKVKLSLTQFSFPPNNVQFPPPDDSAYLIESKDPLPPASVRILDAPYFIGSARKGGDFTGSEQFLSPYETVSLPMVLAEPASRYQADWFMRYDPAYDNGGVYLVGPPIVSSSAATSTAIDTASGLTVGPYCVVGKLQTTIGEFDGITDGTIATMVINNLFRTLTSPQLISMAGQYFFINDEVFYWEPGPNSFVTPKTTGALVGSVLTMSNLRRSRMDTVKQAHAIGDDVRILQVNNLGQLNGYAVSPPVKFSDSGLLSPFPLFRFNGQSYFAGTYSDISTANLTGQVYEGYEPGIRSVRPLRPHNTKIGASARSSSPVTLVRGAAGTVSWRIRSRWLTGTTDDAGTTEHRVFDPTTIWRNIGAVDYDFQNNSMYSEYDVATAKYNQYRVMVQDHAGTIFNLGNTVDSDYKAKSLAVTWPAGAVTGTGLLWVEAYNAYGDSSRFKDTLPINLT